MAATLGPCGPPANAIKAGRSAPEEHAGLKVKRAAAELCCDDGAPVTVSGSNIYAAWSNATFKGDTVLFTKSNDGGKTFSKTMVISEPSAKTFVIARNVTISASGDNVAVTWRTNETGQGLYLPVIRTSSDGGNTFANITSLNVTSGGINK